MDFINEQKLISNKKHVTQLGDVNKTYADVKNMNFNQY